MEEGLEFFADFLHFVSSTIVFCIFYTHETLQSILGLDHHNSMVSEWKPCTKTYFDLAVEI